MMDVGSLCIEVKMIWRLTWVSQDGVCLGQKLVTADSLVAFSTPGGEKREREREREIPSVIESGKSNGVHMPLQQKSVCS